MVFSKTTSELTTDNMYVISQTAISCMFVRACVGRWIMRVLRLCSVLILCNIQHHAIISLSCK